jgi:hypothetical protein
MSRWVIDARLKLIVVPIDSTWTRRSLADGSRARLSHTSRARAGRSRQRQSKRAGSTGRCTRTALVTAPFSIWHHIPDLHRAPMWLFPLGLPKSTSAGDQWPDDVRLPQLAALFQPPPRGPGFPDDLDALSLMVLEGACAFRVFNFSAPKPRAARCYPRPRSAQTGAVPLVHLWPRVS